jgi:hypothetical protein
MRWQLACRAVPLVLAGRPERELRLPEWHARQTVNRFQPCGLSEGLVGLAFVGSFLCSAALPWHAWRMRPSVSFFALCGGWSIDLHCARAVRADLGNRPSRRRVLRESGGAWKCRENGGKPECRNGVLEPHD